MENFKYLYSLVTDQHPAIIYCSGSTKSIEEIVFDIDKLSTAEFETLYNLQQNKSANIIFKRFEAFKTITYGRLDIITSCKY